MGDLSRDLVNYYRQKLSNIIADIDDGHIATPSGLKDYLNALITQIDREKEVFKDACDKEKERAA